eukprot:TRINITY_DN6160_c0_g1_i5.p1 TRINITY_DN6160_c0_g1~~TRINITY_DN6160_c0_g1_i5.p1  ORF type:complete len:175 (-),score=11.33 TRINITY_DN6160_c0_g1_i5:198-722(-)
MVPRTDCNIIGFCRRMPEPLHASRRHLCTRHSLRKTDGTSLSRHYRNRRKTLRTCSSLHRSLSEEWGVQLVTASTVLGWELNRHIAEPLHANRIHLCTRHSLRKTDGTSLSRHYRNRRKTLRTCSSLHSELVGGVGRATGDGLNGVGLGAEPPHCGAAARESNTPVHAPQFAED